MSETADAGTPSPPPRRVYAEDGGPYQCPCCYLMTLGSSCRYEICPECGWEDDGQDDYDADVVRGGANGSLSLTAARVNHAAMLRENPDDPDSVTRGGRGLWGTASLRQYQQTLAELAAERGETAPTLEEIIASLGE